MPPPDYTLVALLVSACGALFALYKRGVDQTIKSTVDSCAAKDEEIKWLRSQLEPWSAIARTMVVAVEKLTESQQQQP